MQKMSSDRLMMIRSYKIQGNPFIVSSHSPNLISSIYTSSYWVPHFLTGYQLVRATSMSVMFLLYLSACRKHITNSENP